MVGGAYPRSTAHVGMIKERAFRTQLSTKDAALTEVLAIDTPEEGALAVLRNVLKREQRYTVGGGRVANLVSELGFDPADESMNFYLQTAKLLYAVMGTCSTAGTSYAPAKTGTVSSGGGTAILTLSIAMTPDAHIGDMLIITAGDQNGSKYEIIDNDASTVTLDVITDANIDSDTFEIVTAPFTKTITIGHSCAPPTFAMHFKLSNECDAAENILNDMLGILFASLELTIEKGGDAIQAAGLVGAKSVTSTAITDPADLTMDTLKWGHVESDFYIRYNSVDVINKDICDSIKVRIENDVELKHVIADFYANYIKYGTVDYTTTFHYMPRSKTFYDLINTKIKDYLTTISGYFKITESTDRWMTFTFNSLYLNDHPTEIPSKEDSELGVDAELKVMPRDNAGSWPAGTLVIVSKDDLGLKHFEGSTLPT